MFKKKKTCYLVASSLKPHQTLPLFKIKIIVDPSSKSMVVEIHGFAKDGVTFVVYKKRHPSPGSRSGISVVFSLFSTLLAMSLAFHLIRGDNVLLACP